MPDSGMLDTLHVTHLSLLNPHHSTVIGNHLAAVHATGRRSKVLDVGTGTGTFAIQLANAHPYADVIAIDNDWSHFASPRAISNGNVDFATVGESTVPSVRAWNPSDLEARHVVHVKGLLLHLPHYCTVVERLAVVLRPGGLFVLVESEPGYRTSQGPLSPGLKTLDACVQQAFSARGTSALRALDTLHPAHLDVVRPNLPDFVRSRGRQSSGIRPLRPGYRLTRAQSSKQPPKQSRLWLARLLLDLLHGLFRNDRFDQPKMDPQIPTRLLDAPPRLLQPAERFFLVLAAAMYPERQEEMLAVRGRVLDQA
ncbi:hypothetical protein P7C73_g6660, partial [Tremellales sp. Uapishka_1]